MKKIIVFFLAVASLVGMTQPAHSATSIPIDVRVKIPEQNAPRTPVVVPISAMVQGNTVYVAFTENLGDVDYELENLGTGELVSDQVVGTGVVLIPFSGDSGDYTISFTLSNGVQFYGEFSL